MTFTYIPTCRKNRTVEKQPLDSLPFDRTRSNLIAYYQFNRATFKFKRLNTIFSAHFKSTKSKPDKPLHGLPSRTADSSAGRCRAREIMRHCGAGAIFYQCDALSLLPRPLCYFILFASYYLIN